MVRTISIAGVVILALTGFSGLVCGQDDISQPAPPAKGRTFLGDLRNSLFGGPIKGEPQPAPRKPAPADAKAGPATTARSAAVIAPPAPTRALTTGTTASGAVAAPGATSLVAKRPVAAPDRVIADEAFDLSNDASGDSLASGAASGLPTRPLHERMSAFRKSSFGNEEDKPDASTIAVPSDEPIEPAAKADARLAVPRDTNAASRATAAQRPRQTATAAASPRPTAQGAMSGKAPRENLVIARKSPILSVETIGPRRITVGKESSYHLVVTNSGEVPADEVVVFVNLPAWAEVIGSESLVGTTLPGISGDDKRPLQWKVGQLSSGARERLTLRIVPRESRPFDLGVRWDYRPVASQGLIEVQEPKLAMHLEGPREVYYGKRELFTLRLANTGTGDAENVAIALMPIGTGENQPATHRIGLIGAGEEKAIEIELTARQTGDLSVQVEARADGDIHAELSEKVLVRRAAVNVEIVGPNVQFVNSMAHYRVRVANPGNTAARNVRLTAILPAGAKYVSGIENAKVEAGGTKVHWTTDSIRSQAEQVYSIKCSLAAAGQSRLEVVALADDDINATASAVTRVEAIADVALEVRDPSGPVAIGDEAVYQLRVFNRGTKAAEGVEVLAFFSNGVEPIAVEGGQHRIQPGQVAFSPIATIAPGAEVVLKIRAKADQAGAHVFRAEAHCKALGTRLVREETTHFYLDNPAGPSAPQTAAGSIKPLPNSEPPREGVESASGANLPKYGPLKR